MVVQLLHLIVAILFYNTYANVCDNRPECVILENPKTSVIKYNDTVVVTCGIIDYVDTFAPSLMIFDNSLTNFEDVLLEDQGITNVNCNETTKLCTATVLGNDMNNGIEIHCIVGGCCTESSFTYVVDGIPDPPDPPVVTFINTMSLNISWSSPWNSSRIPVNNYTLIITDNNTGIQDTIITTDTYYIFERQDNDVNCDVYYFSVFADTDVGETEASSFIIFPTKLDLTLDAELINSTKNYTVIEQTEQKPFPSLHISFEPPTVCDHEVLTYQFKLKDLLPPFNEVVRNSGGNSSAVIELSSYIFHDNVLMVSVEVNVSNGYTSIIIPLYDNITVINDTSITTTTTNGGTNTTFTFSFSIIVSIVVVCGAMAAIIACLGILLIFYCCIYRKSNRTVLDDANKNITFLSIIQKPLEDEVKNEQELKAKQIADEINLKCERNLYI